MARKKETQIEDSQSAAQEEKVEPKTEMNNTEKPKKTFWQRSLPWVIVALVFFLGGAALIYFTLYSTAKAGLALQTDNAAKSAASLTTCQADLGKANDSLTAAQTTLTQTSADLAKEQKLAILYKFQADVNAARAYLDENDLFTAGQTMALMTDDLTKMQALGFTADEISGLQSRLDTVQQNLPDNPTKAIQELEKLYQNLDLMIKALG
jgi:cytoskeletal protein RodZ